MRTCNSYIISFCLYCVLSMSCASETENAFKSLTFKKLVLKEKNTYSSIETDLVNLINTHRGQLGIPTLTLSNIISSVSESHTIYMVAKDEASHDNFRDRSGYLIENAEATYVAENVAYGYHTATGILNGYINSEEHREVIENSDLTHIGVSIIKNTQNRNFNTIMFISKQ